MLGVIVSYFNMIEGSKTLVKYPETLGLSENQLLQINKGLDMVFEKSFFAHQFEFSNTANYYTEISSEWARGGKESLLISVLINSGENTEIWKEPLEEFVTAFENIPEIYKGIHYFTPKLDPEVKKKYQELTLLVKNFYESIPETITIQRTVKLFMFGLDRAGKTSLSKRFSENLYENTSPTLWLDVHNFRFQNCQFVCFDMGGQQQFRSFWKNYLHNSEILIFVIDGSRPARLSEAKAELWNIIDVSTPDIPLLILNNKSDLKSHSDNIKIITALSLEKLKRPWQIIITSAKSGLGIPESLNWIANQLVVR